MPQVYHDKCQSKNVESLCTFPDISKQMDPAHRKEGVSDVIYNCRNCGESFAVRLFKDESWYYLNMEDVYFEDNNTK